MSFCILHFTVWLNIEVANQYTFFANDGRALYLGQEESDCCAQQFCKNARGFKLFIRDPDGNGILLERPLVCCLTVSFIYLHILLMCILL